MNTSGFDDTIEEKLNAVISLTNQALLIVRADFSKVIYVSNSWEKVFGTKKELLIANPASWMEVVLPEYIPLLQGQIKEMIKTGQVPKSSDFRITWPDGSIHWVSGNALPIKDGSHRVVEIAAIITNITKEKDLQTQLDSYTSRLEEEVAKRAKGLEEAQSIAKMGSWEWDVVKILLPGQKSFMKYSA